MLLNVFVNLTKSCYLLSCTVYYFWFFSKKKTFCIKLCTLNIEDWTKYFAWTSINVSQNFLDICSHNIIINHDIQCFHNSFYHTLGTFFHVLISLVRGNMSTNRFRKWIMKVTGTTRRWYFIDLGNFPVRNSPF